MSRGILSHLQDALVLRGAYKRLFAADNEDGQRVLSDICRSADVMRSCFTPGKPDQTAYDNGARDLALGILRKIHSSDEELRKQIGELYAQEQTMPQ